MRWSSKRTGKLSFSIASKLTEVRSTGKYSQHVFEKVPQRKAFLRSSTSCNLWPNGMKQIDPSRDTALSNAIPSQTRQNAKAELPAFARELSVDLPHVQNVAVLFGLRSATLPREPCPDASLNPPFGSTRTGKGTSEMTCSDDLNVLWSSDSDEREIDHYKLPAILNLQLPQHD